jgi:KaiC/GvpD/RAD55 family RecA-like ATPase
MNPLFDWQTEEATLAAFYQGHIHALQPDWYTDERRVLATVLQPRPRSRAALTKRLKANGLDTLPIDFLFVPVRMDTEDDKVALTSSLGMLSEYMLRRCIADASNAMSAVARDFGKDGLALMADTSRIYDEVAVAAQGQADVDETQKTADWFEKQHLAGTMDFGWVMTWAPVLNEYLGPLGEVFMVIAGLPGSGKTMAQMAMGLDYAKQGARWLFVSPDMGTKDLWLRLVSMHSGIPYRRLRRHRGDKLLLTTYEKQAAEDASQELRQLPIRIESTTNTTQVIARARAWGADVLMVDYLDLMRKPELASQGEYAQIRGTVFDLADEARRCLVVLSAQVGVEEPSIYGTSWGKDLSNRATIFSWITRLRKENVTIWKFLKNRNDQLAEISFTVLVRCMRMLEIPLLPVGYSVPVTF